MLIHFHANEIELKKIIYDVIFCDVIAITSLKNVTKITSQKFSILGPSQSKFLATPLHQYAMGRN